MEEQRLVIVYVVGHIEVIDVHPEKPMVLANSKTSGSSSMLDLMIA